MRVISRTDIVLIIIYSFISYRIFRRVFDMMEHNKENNYLMNEDI